MALTRESQPLRHGLTRQRLASIIDKLSNITNFHGVSREFSGNSFQHALRIGCRKSIVTTSVGCYWHGFMTQNDRDKVSRHESEREDRYKFQSGTLSVVSPLSRERQRKRRITSETNSASVNDPRHAAPRRALLYLSIKRLALSDVSPLTRLRFAKLCFARYSGECSWWSTGRRTDGRTRRGRSGHADRRINVRRAWNL